MSRSTLEPGIQPSLVRMVIFLSILHMPVSVWAYDVDSGHAPITNIAFDVYVQCFPNDNTFNHRTRRNARLGNMAMDKGVNKLPPQYWASPRVLGLFSLSLRSVNWHFYNPQKTAEVVTRHKAVEQSQRRLWKHAKAGFKAMNQASSKSFFLGALLHLIEDVSVPAHVVPVYHGPASVTHLGKFEPLVDYLRPHGRIHDNKIHDAIDALPPDGTWLRSQFQPDSKNCQDIVAGTPDVIRRQLAQHTLAALQTNIEHCGDATWKLFWNGEIDASAYFEAYNTAIPEFNRNGHIINEHQQPQCIMREGDWRYRAFVNARHLAALKADLRLLRWASGRMAR